MDLGVLHPWLLALALAAILPWWLSRRRARPETLAWGASRWLAAAAARILPAQARQRRWTLWLRVLILLWLAVAMAIPRSLVSTAPGITSAQPQTWWILLIDDGPTATAKLQERPVIDQILEQARTLLPQISSADGVSAIGTSQPSQWRLAGPEGTTTQRESALDSWNIGPWAADGFAALRSIMDRIETQQTLGRSFDRIKIIVWSHPDSPAWRHASEASNASLLSNLEKIASIHWQSVGDFRRGNLAILDVSPSLDRVLPLRAQTLSATILNHDSQQSVNRRLRWLIDDTPTGSTLVSLAPGERRAVLIELPPLPAGEHRLQLELEADGLEVDSTWWSVIHADQRLPYSLDGDDPRSRSILVEWAEALRRSNRGEWVSPEILMDSPTVRPLRIVFGGKQADETTIANLRTHLAAGGAVLLWCDSQMNPGSWLEALNLPSPTWRPSEPRWHRVLLGDQRPASMSVFEGPALSTLTSTPIWRSWVPEGPLSPEWTTWMSLAPWNEDVAGPVLTSAPLVLSRDVLQGRLVLITTAMGDGTSENLAATQSVPEAWSAWALWPSFPPFVEQLIQSLVVREGSLQRRFDVAVLARGRSTPSSSTIWQRINVSPDAESAASSQESTSAAATPPWPGIFRREGSSQVTLQAWNLTADATTPSEDRGFTTWSSNSTEALVTEVSPAINREPDPLPMLLGILLTLLLLETWVSERSPHRQRRSAETQPTRPRPRPQEITP